MQLPFLALLSTGYLPMALSPWVPMSSGLTQRQNRNKGGLKTPGPKVPHRQLLNYKASTIYHTIIFKIQIELRGKNKRKKTDQRTSWSLLHSFHLLVRYVEFKVNSFFLILYFVLGYSWFTNNAVTVSVNRKGTQPYIHVYPFSPKLPSHPGYHTTLTEFHVLYHSSQAKFLKTIFLFLLPNSVFSCIQFVVWPFTSFLISTLIFFISTSSH